MITYGGLGDVTTCPAGYANSPSGTECWPLKDAPVNLTGLYQMAVIFWPVTLGVVATLYWLWPSGRK